MTAQRAEGAGSVPAAPEWQEDAGHTTQAARVAQGTRTPAWRPEHFPVDQLIMRPKHDSCADRLTLLGHTVLFASDLLCFFGSRSTNIRCLFADI